MADKIYVQVGNEKQEATGKTLEYIKFWQAEIVELQRLIEAEAQAKQAKLDSAKAKLAALGLDEEEVQAIIGGI